MLHWKTSAGSDLQVTVKPLEKNPLQTHASVILCMLVCVCKRNLVVSPFLNTTHSVQLDKLAAQLCGWLCECVHHFGPGNVSTTPTTQNEMAFWTFIVPRL